MADWYCDTSKPGAADYSATPTAAGTVPTKCEDGNGKGTGTATLASYKITFTGIPAAAGTVTVAGVTFTAVASGATGNQFNAVTSATQCATNLVAAINASTTNAVKPVGEIAATAPLRNVVNATSSAGVVTIYTRIGSAAWNSVTETSTLTNASIAQQWTGGSDGAWGYLFNVAAIAFPTSQAVGLYGAMVTTYLGIPAAGDVIHIRTKRSGSNIQLLLGATITSVACRTIGSETAYLEYRADNGTKWSGDSGIFEVVQDANSALVLQLNGYTYWHGQMQSGTWVNNGAQPNWRFKCTYTNNAGYISNIRLNSLRGTAHTIIEGIEITDDGAGTSTVGGWQFTATGNGDTQRSNKVINCRFGVARAGQGPFVSQGATAMTVEAEDCHFSYGGISAYTAAVILFLTSASYAANVRLLRPKFSGGGGGHHSLIGLYSSAMQQPISLVIDDPIDMGQFLAGDSAASLCGRLAGGASAAVIYAGAGYASLQSVNASNQFVYDNSRMICEWRSGFPTTGISLLPDGTAYSIRFSTPHTGLATGLVTAYNPQRGIKQQVVNALADGTRTLTQLLLIDDTFGNAGTYTPTDANWWIEGTYVDTGGTVQRFSTRGTGTSLTADSATTWSALNYGGRTQTRWKITVSLANLKSGTVVTSYLVCATQPNSMAELVFFDPEFTLA